MENVYILVLALMDYCMTEISIFKSICTTTVQAQTTLIADKVEPIVNWKLD